MMEEKLIAAIEAGDEVAGKEFVERYAAPLFRYCRLEFTDHHRTGEFVERYLASYLSGLYRRELKDHTLETFFGVAGKLANLSNLDSVRGQGLSIKQRRILELMESLELPDRLALDLMELENHQIEDVTQWLGVSDDQIRLIQRKFGETLATDGQIMEFLENAAIQQSKQRRAETRTNQNISRPTADRRIPEPERERKTSDYTRTWHSSRDEDPPEQGRDTGRESEEESDGTAEKHKKPRPRRRRVDPRKLNIEI